MLKMVITARRNPSMARPEFFRHLREKHWPTVRRHEEPYALLLGYLQNHALGPAAPASIATPFRLEQERDSVIELWFESDAALARLVQMPDYLAYVRPDEAVFNDLPSNIMVRTADREYFRAVTMGRCKRFDFIARGVEVDAEEFAEALDADGCALALDPYYTAHVDRHVHNLARASEDGHGSGGQGAGGHGLAVTGSAKAATIACARCGPQASRR